MHPDQWESWLKAQPPRIRTTVAAHRLTGKAGNRAVLPGEYAPSVQSVVNLGARLSQGVREDVATATAAIRIRGGRI